MSTLAAILAEYVSGNGDGFRATGAACYTRLDDVTLLEFSE